MKIGMVSTSTGGGHAIRGIGFYARRLTAALRNIPGVEVIESDAKSLESAQDIDLIHYPFFDLFFHTLPMFSSKKRVITVHDVIPLEFPKHYPIGPRGKISFELQKLALKTVDRIITDSFASVNSILKYLNVDNDKLKLVYLAAESKFKKISNKSYLKKISDKYNLPKKFLLYVGDLNWNKNIPTLVAGAKECGLPLVMVGKNAANIKHIDLSPAELRHLKSVDFSSVIALGFITDEDLVGIYNLASAYCQPSFAEGFGLPVLEALACNTPVVCSNTHSLPEIATGYAKFFNPNDTRDLVNAINGSINTKVMGYRSNFSWEKTADETVKIYKEIL